MRKLNFVLPVVFLVLCCPGIWAANVTVTVVQNEAAPAIALEMSQTIEDEMLGNYFESGQIVSNTELRFDGAAFSQKNFGIKAAAFGLSDYLVVISLQYGPAEILDTEKKTTYAELNTLTCRLVHVLSSVIVAEKSIDVTKIPVQDFDPYARARNIADQVSSESLKALQNRKTGEKNK